MFFDKHKNVKNFGQIQRYFFLQRTNFITSPKKIINTRERKERSDMHNRGSVPRERIVNK